MEPPFTRSQLDFYRVALYNWSITSFLVLKTKLNFVQFVVSVCRLLLDALRTSIQILKPRVNGDGLELDEENLMKIFNHPDVDDLPVMLVSIYGAMRQGKSFLLSLLIMYLESCKVIVNKYIFVA